MKIVIQQINVTLICSVHTRNWTCICRIVFVHGHSQAHKLWFRKMWNAYLVHMLQVWWFLSQPYCLSDRFSIHQFSQWIRAVQCNFLTDILHLIYLSLKKCTFTNLNLNCSIWDVGKGLKKLALYVLYNFHPIKNKVSPKTNVKNNKKNIQ